MKRKWDSFYFYFFFLDKKLGECGYKSYKASKIVIYIDKRNRTSKCEGSYPGEYISEQNVKMSMASCSSQDRKRKKKTRVDHEKNKGQLVLGLDFANDKEKKNL